MMDMLMCTSCTSGWRGQAGDGVVPRSERAGFRTVSISRVVRFNLVQAGVKGTGTLKYSGVERIRPVRIFRTGRGSFERRFGTRRDGWCASGADEHSSEVTDKLSASAGKRVRFCRVASLTDV